MGCNSDECTFPKRERFNFDSYYCLEGKDLNYLDALKNRLGQMTRMNSDEMRNAMNKLFVILVDAIEMTDESWKL